MIPDLIEFRQSRRVRKEEFLKNNRIHGEANPIGGFRGKELRSRRVTTQVSNDHLRIEEHEWPHRARPRIEFELLRIG